MTANPATETIWSQLSDALRRFIRRRVADEHVADDLLQETFLRILLTAVQSGGGGRPNLVALGG
jgi:DNA-directed RNA polymerase specialized sigma24 family protein